MLSSAVLGAVLASPLLLFTGYWEPSAWFYSQPFCSQPFCSQPVKPSSQDCVQSTKKERRQTYLIEARKRKKRHKTIRRWKQQQRLHTLTKNMLDAAKSWPSLALDLSPRSAVSALLAVTLCRSIQSAVRAFFISAMRRPWFAFLQKARHAVSSVSCAIYLVEDMQRTFVARQVFLITVSTTM
jgi:hypothetical protein